MASEAPKFDPVQCKESIREQWQSAAEAWNRWGPTLARWLGPATEIMLDMAGVAAGSRVLDVAAGAGEQTQVAARRVGPSGHVLATDISANILEFAARGARESGLTAIETRVMDGEELGSLEEGSFDAVISRLGLFYFPDPQKALSGMRRALRKGRRIAAIAYSTAERNGFSSIPISIIRRRAQLPAPLPGQPGPFNLGGPGVLEAAYAKAGFRNIEIRVVEAPLRLSSAAECVRFEQESFGMRQMMSGLEASAREETLREIERELRKFERAGRFEGPCELVIGAGEK